MRVQRICASTEEDEGVAGGVDRQWLPEIDGAQGGAGALEPRAEALHWRERIGLQNGDAHG